MFGVGHVGRQSIVGKRGVQGASLDLGFMSPGVLDPRITFTRASTATYFDATGTMQTAATNTPRWDYNPSTHALNGLLIEEARTNQLLQSANLSVWNGNANVTITAGQSGAPDGTATVSQVMETAVTAAHQALQNTITMTSGMTIASVYAKLVGGGRYLQIRLDDTVTGTNGGSATFDLQTGTITGALTATGSGTIGTATIQLISNGWYRCTAAINPGTTSGRLALRCCNTGAGNTNYAGNTANGFLLWGAQVELGAFPTSYIPTTAASVTRAVDVATMTTAGWFTSPGGSWMAEFISNNPLVAASFRRVVTINAAASIAPITVDNTASRLGQYDGTGAIFTANAITVGVIAKGATTWSVGASTECLNGSAVVSSAALTGGYSSMVGGGVRFLSNATPAEGMSGYIRRVRYWPRALTDAELQSVTT